MNVHNISLRRQSSTEPQTRVTCIRNLVKIWLVVPKIWSWTDKHTQRHTDGQTDTLITILRSRTGGGVITNQFRVLAERATMCGPYAQSCSATTAAPSLLPPLDAHESSSNGNWFSCASRLSISVRLDIDRSLGGGARAWQMTTIRTFSWLSGKLRARRQRRIGIDTSPIILRISYTGSSSSSSSNNSDRIFARSFMVRKRTPFGKISTKDIFKLCEP